MAAIDHLEKTIIRYLMPHNRPEMRKGRALKKCFSCREKDCLAKLYLTLIGRVNRFLKNEALITKEFSHWFVQFHKNN
jgi:hypothetical protein